MLRYPPSPPTWKTQVYRVRDERSQRRILAVFERVTAGVACAGARSGAGSFVVLECRSRALELAARRILLHLDASAELSHECESPPPGARPLRQTYPPRGDRS